MLFRSSVSFTSLTLCLSLSLSISIALPQSLKHPLTCHPYLFLSDSPVDAVPYDLTLLQKCSSRIFSIGYYWCMGVGYLTGQVWMRVTRDLPSAYFLRISQRRNFNMIILIFAIHLYQHQWRVSVFLSASILLFSV